MLVSHLGKVGTKNGFLFLGTCHAGAIRLDIGPARIRPLYPGRFAALDSYDGTNGVFAYTVREGLKGKARPSPTGQSTISSSASMFPAGWKSLQNKRLTTKARASRYRPRAPGAFRSASRPEPAPHAHTNL
jgi:hypothetical protein